jgi:transposase
MQGIHYSAAKAAVTDVERKVNIYHTIKRKGLSALQIQKKYQVSRSTAFHWLKMTKDIKDHTLFVKKVGRPPILSDCEVLEAKATINEMTRKSEPLNAAIYTENIKNAKGFLTELIEEQNACKLFSQHTILTPRMLYKQMARRLQLKQMEARYR